jgi:hypothetical protein
VHLRCRCGRSREPDRRCGRTRTPNPDRPLWPGIRPEGLGLGRSEHHISGRGDQLGVVLAAVLHQHRLIEPSNGSAPGVDHRARFLVRFFVFCTRRASIALGSPTRIASATFALALALCSRRVSMASMSPALVAVDLEAAYAFTFTRCASTTVAPFFRASAYAARCAAFAWSLHVSLTIAHHPLCVQVSC